MMTAIDRGLAGQSITELKRGLEAKRYSAREVIEDLFRRAERFKAYNAFAYLDQEAALKAAKAVDEALAKGQQGSRPLGGVPVSVKDLINTAGMRTAYGCRLYADHVPAADATCVAQVRAAGGIIFGKSTTPEFGHKIMTDSPLHGATGNPWNIQRSCGGSSGGAAVAVALGLGPIAITTDGAGSSRIPAAVCGVYGLKPSLGRVPNDGASDVFNLMVYNGIMARMPEDLGIGLRAMSAPHAGDPWSRYFPPMPPLAERPSVAGKRFLMIRRYSNRYLDPEIEAALEDTGRKLEAAGAVVEEFDGSTFEWSLDVARRLLRVNQAARYTRMVAEQREELDPSFVRIVEEAQEIDITRIGADMQERTRLYQRVDALFAQADYLLMPTTAGTALPITQNQHGPFVLDGKEIGSLRDEWYPYTIPYNVTGHPALSLPHSLHTNGLPIGIHVVGRWGDEVGLIDIARAMDEVTAASRLAAPPLRQETVQ